MLAVLGFTVTGILFWLFARSCNSLQTKATAATLGHYKQAYYLLATAFLLFGGASAVGTQQALSVAVVIGDLLLAIASYLVLQILLEGSPHKKEWLMTAIVVGVGLLAVRTLFFYPQPYMQDDVLFFNSQRFVSFALTAVFLLLWLPVNLRMSQLLAPKVRSLMAVYTFLYTAATLSAAIFLLSKTSLALTLSFTALAVSFVLLILSNIYAVAIKEAHHGK